MNMPWRRRCTRRSREWNRRGPVGCSIRRGCWRTNRRADLVVALPLLQRALAIEEKSLGADHPNVARDANNIGQILQTQGDLEGANAHFTRRHFATKT